ncbi:tetratricopeptide repeat protein [Fusobacterium pseudoperiodonticum]|uniref:GlcNAc transferase n=1 Tax=Fusobacterium pseudoperiodonticum TaxID=2663009 RepID=A0A2D3NX93_9FUSO|nr:tetratricopeptide repeat protein [Fusobacterium pseudoperiodonticum]ATV59626.1 GlcNAc transferase [Fusobacterium pseudoperiodonticum]
MKEKLLEKIENLNEMEKYQEIIDLIEALPAEQLNTELMGELGRAYNNIEEYEKGLEILKSIENEVGDTALWNWRIGYSYFFLEDYTKAEKHFLKVCEQEPDDEKACDFLVGTYIALGEIEEENGNSEKAIEYAFEAKKYAKTRGNKIDTEIFLASLYNRHMRYVEAEEILRPILAKNKRDVEGNYELGYSLFKQERYEEALEYFLKLEKLDYADEWLYQKIGICYKNLDEKEEALKYYLKAVELDEEDTYSMSDIAWLYNVLGKYEEGLKYLEKLEELGQDDAWTNGEFGYCLSRLERHEEAIKKLNHALEVEDEEKDIAHIHSLLGWSYRQLEDYDKALEHYIQSKENGRDSAWINDEIGYCYKKKSDLKKALEFYLLAEKYDKNDLDLVSEIAWVYSILGEYKEGLKYTERAVKLGRNDAWINIQYGACLANSNRFQEAIEKLEYALSLDEEKDLAFAYSQLGWCYRLLGDYEKALGYHIKSQEEGRNDAWINFEIAICYENLNDYEKALEYALISYELDKDEVNVLSEIGWLYNYMGKYEDALPFLLKAQELGRNDEGINTEIAVSLGRSGNVKEAIEKLKKSLTMVDQNDINQRIFINSELGWYYGKLEEPYPEEALKYLNIAKDLGREDAWLYSQIAYQLGYNSETKNEALEYFDKAIELGGNDAWIFETKGVILLDLEKYEEALESFKKAYARDNNGWYLYAMGRCLRGLERYEEAIEILLKSRQISLAEEDVVDGEDFELAYCYIGIGDKENAQKYLDSARESITERGAVNDAIKAKIKEIEKEISSLDTLFN